MATRCSGTGCCGTRCCGTRCCGIRSAGIRSGGTRSAGTGFFGIRPSLIRVSRLTTPSLHEPRARETRGTGDLGAVEGDLRPVTIVFADIRGFTRLSEVLAPEKLVAAINGCFEVLDTAIGHYGGEVDKFLGDAVMATFGAHVAHDDDPRRAVRIRGKDAPVHSYVVLGQATGGRRRAALDRHLGRDTELQQLHAAFAP